MIELKITGAGLIVLSSAALGFAVSYDMKRRIKDLTGLKKGYKLLEQEITLRKSHLQEALETVGVMLEQPWRNFFSDLSERMKHLSGTSFSELWEEAIRTLPENLSLQKEDEEWLRQAGRELESSGIAGYRDLLLFQEQRLDDLIREAEKEYAEKARLYSRLGVIGGIFLVILMF